MLSAAPIPGTARWLPQLEMATNGRGVPSGLVPHPATVKTRDDEGDDSRDSIYSYD